MCLGAIYWARLDHLYFAATQHDAAQAGFDDAFIYRELALDPKERSLPTQQLLHEPSLQAFADWRDKEDRTDY